MDKKTILAIRKIIDEYRQKHSEIYQKYSGEELTKKHTEILKEAIEKIEALGVRSKKRKFENKVADILDRFFEASELLNIQELGYNSLEEFYSKASEDEVEFLEKKWH